jgi:hypothetical protein
MGYTPGRDKPLFLVGTHTVMHDKYQIVIQHPSTCNARGSRLDKYKTFHPWKLALKQLATCGESLTTEQHECLVARGIAVHAEPRG